MTLAEPRLPRLTGWLRPLVDGVARIDASVHRKLLFGFLAGALLLVALAILSLVVIGRMNERVNDLDRLQEKTSRAQQMLYAVTAQSHYRAMALLTHDDKFNIQIVDAKKTFSDLLDEMDQADQSDTALLASLRADNATYTAASQQVLAKYLAGDLAGATALHLDQEHPISHLLEASLRTLIGSANDEIAQAQAAFESDRMLLTTAVVGFSAVSVAVALLLGFILSWAFILPIRKMERALAGITAGDLSQRVDVPNRDELGKLARDLNQTTERLAQLREEEQALTRRLEESNASLARASEAKSRFLASVSHELRTPMNAILGFTDALLGGVDGRLNPEQTASLGWVQRGGRDLLGLINEILDLSKIEAGRLTIDPQPFDPRELVESVVAQYRSLAAQKGIRFAWHNTAAPTEVVLDRQRVSQILVNLFGNALKFTKEGEVEIETGGAPDRSSAWPSAIRGPGSRPTSMRPSSRSSSRPPATRPAPAWAWPSAAGWHGSWAVISRWRASPVEAVSSTSRCRSTAGSNRRPRSEPSVTPAPRRRASCSALMTTLRSRRCSRRCSRATATGSSPRRARSCRERRAPPATHGHPARHPDARPRRPRLLRELKTDPETRTSR